MVAKPKAVIYCRVSTKEQVEEGNSLKTQEKICTEYAEKNGYEVVHVYIEQGESAKTADRPELQKMLTQCSVKKNGIKAIITYKIDRISRNTDDYSRIRIRLKKMGVELKSTSEFFENSPVGRFLENTMASIAELDNSIRAERCTNGMKEAIREGRYVWSAPAGYDNGRVDGRPNLVPNKMAPLILETFQEVAKGNHLTEEVRKIMFKKGLTNKHGQPFAKSYFYELLRNKTYTGTIEKFGESHKGTYTPLVSENLFRQVQHVLKQKGRRSTSYLIDHEDFPLRRFIRHKNGSKLRGCWSVGGSGKKYAYYYFQGLPRHIYKKEILEKKFQQFLDKYALAPKQAKTLSQEVIADYKSRTGSKLEEIEQLLKRLDKVKEQGHRLAQKSINGILPDHIVKVQSELLENEEMQIGSKLLHYETVKLPIPNAEKLLSDVKGYMTQPGLIWKSLRLEFKLMFQEFAFPQGISFDGKKLQTPEVTLFFKAYECFLGTQSSMVDPRDFPTNEYLHQCTYLKKIDMNNKAKTMEEQRDIESY